MGRRGTESGDEARTLRVERSVRSKNSGVTVEYAVGTEAEEASEVRVRQPLDPDVPLEEARFHPQREPATWNVEGDVLTFEATVPGDESFETVFGAVADESFLAGDPRVERLDGGEAESGGFLSGVRGMFSRSGDGKEEAPAEPERDARGEDVTVLSGGEPPAGNSFADGEADQPVEESNRRTEGVTPDEPGGADGVADKEGRERGEVGDGADAPEPDGGDSPPERSAEPESEPDTGTDGDPEEDGPAGDPGSADDEPDSTGFEGAAAETNPEEAARAVVSALEGDEELRAALRDTLGVGGSGEERTSVDTRLRHVQSRVDDLAAYTAALEESIDEHGEPAAAFSELKAETEALRDDVGGVEAEVAAVREEHDELAGRVDDLAGATEALRSELTEAGERRDARIERVESDVDGVATDLRAARDELNTEMEAVRSELDELRAMRESLSEAFGPPSGSATGGTDAEPEAASGERE
jgi:predicted  nucleic acid-binding Zn-ribbon protein